VVRKLDFEIRALSIYVHCTHIPDSVSHLLMIVFPGAILE